MPKRYQIGPCNIIAKLTEYRYRYDMGLLDSRAAWSSTDMLLDKRDLPVHQRGTMTGDAHASRMEHETGSRPCSVLEAPQGVM